MSDYFICPNELGGIMISRNISIRKIECLGNVTKRIIKKKDNEHYFQSRICQLGDTIIFFQNIKYFVFPIYRTSSIVFRYPSQIMLKNGIKIGVSSKEDILVSYGEPNRISFNYLEYSLQKFDIWFSIYDQSETDKDFNPNLLNKLTSIIIYPK